MASEEDYEIMPANDLRVGHYAMMKGKTCKVLEIHRSKTGKHGGAKLHLVGLDIFSHKKVEDIIGSSKTLDVPLVRKEDFLIVSIEDEFLTIRLKDSSLRSDVEVPDVDDQKKISKHLQDGHTLVATLTTAMGMETYDSFKRKYK
eukprot:Phypoly_transcript_18652.p1 GENE.Phypoly_transcript_18652~~Phypoly_transcript_18652.p1  ORF type:complete len:145 (+),score=34.50 Phypoly_transcript_18652:198-632(+)